MQKILQWIYKKPILTALIVHMFQVIWIWQPIFTQIIKDLLSPYAGTQNTLTVIALTISYILIYVLFTLFLLNFGCKKFKDNTSNYLTKNISTLLIQLLFFLIIFSVFTFYFYHISTEIFNIKWYIARTFYGNGLSWWFIAEYINFIQLFFILGFIYTTSDKLATHIEIAKTISKNDKNQNMKDEQSQDENTFIIKKDQKEHVIKSSQILWVESAANYVIIHTEEDEYPMRETISNLQKQLSFPFIRCHRSHIINVQCAKEMTQEANRLFVTLRNNEKVPVSTTYKEKIEEYISGNDN